MMRRTCWPAARGELHCVGATTLDDTGSMSRRTRHARRFQPVFVDEPTVEDTVSICAV
jgi:ATP-dependent Clp protease ATP-binding subunit ClpB